MTKDQNSATGETSNPTQHVTGWQRFAPRELARRAAGMDRRTMAWSAVLLAGVLALSINLISSIVFRNMKVDLTADHLYTISQGTRKVLARIDEPITVRVYYSRRLGEVASVFGTYFERVKALLEQYGDISRGRLQVTFVDPVPFSDAEDRAVAAGLRGVRLNQDGETGYFGLVASNTTDNDAVIEFFTPDRERFLEYDLTKLIAGLANPKKKVIGLIAGVSIDGGANPMQPMRQPAPPWTVMNQIREFFEVRPIQETAKVIPPDIDVLLVVQPTLLTEDAAYAIDQYAMSGGRVLAFVDPFVETDRGGQPGAPQLPVSSSMRKLLTAWGVAFDPEKVVGDPKLARRVQYGGRAGQQATVTNYLAWLGIEKPQINEKDPLSAGITTLNLASAGALSKAEGATTIVQPIIETTAQAGLFDTNLVRFSPDPMAINRKFVPGTKPLMLAARIVGEGKSAFPNGRPKPKERPKSGEPAEKTGDTATEAEKKNADPKAIPDKPHVAAGRLNIVVVSDVDMLNDQFWVQVRDFLGQKMVEPIAHNAAFAINALENLSGGEALASLRGRGITERPFERVLRIRADAESHYREKEEGLVAKLKDLQQKLSKVQARGADGATPATVMLSEKEKQSVEQFRGEMIKVRRDLRVVQADLRRDIDDLNWWLRFFNIAAIPLVIGAGGLAYGLSRRIKRRPGR